LRSKERLTNASEIRVFGLRRSGNHAIINWIFQNHPGTVCFLNNVLTRRHFNPYLAFSQSFVKADGEVINYPPQLRFRKVKLTRRWHLQHPRKDCLIYSYEERPLASVAGDELSQQHDRCLGHSDRVTDVLILRDPFNCFASRLRLSGQLTTGVVDLWKEYAREFLGESQSLNAPVPISYNAWREDTAYRSGLAGQLGWKGSDEGVHEVMNIGGGSSFDSTEFDGQAQSMQTGERWRHFKDDPAFRSVFRDRDLVDLSERVFGHIPGTDDITG